ncbi:MAG: 4Fe-4S binding protein [Spirochaetales bacterium]|nr:4Fe-4S binding protein [Spirochaetales bacterium]
MFEKMLFPLALLLTAMASISYFYLARPMAASANNGIWQNGLTARGLAGYALGFFITGFYVLLYWFAEHLQPLIRAMDGLSSFLRAGPADQWFLYGTLYTFAILVMGVRAIIRYRHSAYQIWRTAIIMFSQLFLAYLIPSLLKSLNQPEFYFSYFWPLKPEYLFPGTVAALVNHPGGMGLFFVFWAAVLTFVATPILTYFFGKRWYCSWVCGCGGLANTLGDPWRQLSSKSLRSWQWERYTIHSILIIISALTVTLWLNSFLGGELLGQISGPFARGYGFFIGALFSGVIGVGFYPFFGTRLWCRFGCPMAAYLGLLQRFFSRFRITTNGGQCISCGNCSTYCEMGIDVRAYAQRGENIVRASCVGCGICATVCPRGVLKLENGPARERWKT